MKSILLVRVICFSLVKQVLNRDELEVKLPTGSTVLDLEKTIRDLTKGKLDGIPFRFAVNQEFVSQKRKLKDGDEVAIIPPMQGG